MATGTDDDSRKEYKTPQRNPAKSASRGPRQANTGSEANGARGAEKGKFRLYLSA